LSANNVNDSPCGAALSLTDDITIEINEVVKAKTNKLMDKRYPKNQSESF